MSDAQAVAATLSAAFAPFEALYTTPAFEATTPTAREVAARFDEGPIWLAEENGRILGTVSAVAHANGLYVRSMAVHPDAQGRGIGTELLRAVEEFAATHRHGRMVLTTTPFLHGAIQLYERAGFRRTGEVADLFGTPLFWMAKTVSARGA